MHEVEINNMGELIESLNSFPNHYVYRGQADAQWGLQPTLERVIGQDWSGQSAELFEDHSISRFRSKYHLYGQERSFPQSRLAWLSVMQHHGVPTRLLDFTESPYVGLYFALESFVPGHMNRFAVYALDYTAVMEKALELIGDRNPDFAETRASIRDRQDEISEQIVDQNSYDVLWVAEPQVLNSRLDLQAGSFLLSGNRETRIEDLLAREEYQNVDVRKFSIAGDLYQNAFRLLQKMNITSKSLYGDIEGLAKGIKMELQVYAV